MRSKFYLIIGAFFMASVIASSCSSENNSNTVKEQTENNVSLSRFYGKWKNNKVTGANEWINTYFIINRDGSGDIKSTIHSGFGNQPGLDLHFENVIIQGDLLIFCKDGLSYNSCPKLRITGEYASPLETIEGGLVTKQ